jgi:cell division protein FtsQ
VGNQRILIGNADSLQVKFTNLLTFYKEVLPRVGWDKYSMINVKYSGQVVGIKNENMKADSIRASKAASLKPDSAKMKKDTSQIN